MLIGLMTAGFLLGLASGVHCVGMCGGVLAAFTRHTTGQIIGSPTRRPWHLLLAFNAGRVLSYGAAGAVAGALGAGGVWLIGVLDVRIALFVIAQLMMVLIGLHLAGWSKLLTYAETWGQPLWRHVQPLAARMLPIETPYRALLAGALWGWLPCGLVYAMLVSAVTAGSATGGTAVMLAFGLGTVPHLMFAGLSLLRLRAWLHRPWLRVLAGSVVVGFGLFGLARATTIAQTLRTAWLCW